ncbi:MAG: anhydro-N-acetylmuramic acid kinase [Nitrospira sp.]|nr:anhydro-N-acetylmuramic acid kinase [Nitrospira sp.]
MKVVGLMSGTSADGVDAALVNIVRRGGTSQITLLAFASVPIHAPCSIDWWSSCFVDRRRRSAT